MSAEGSPGASEDGRDEESTASASHSGETRPGAPGNDQNDEEPAESLLAALSVAAHARVGLAVGVGLAGFLYLSRLPALELSLTGSGGYYLGLALVLGATTSALVTAALAIKTFLAPVLDRPAWLRRGGMAAMLGGLTWAALPVLAAAADAGTITRGTWHTATSLAAIALLIGTMGLHAAVTDATGRVERTAYWTILVALVFAAGNATGDPGAIVESDAGAYATPFLTAAFVAFVATIPLAATAELSGQLPRLRTRALQLGALGGAIGVAWLVTLSGGDALVASGLPAEPTALAVATVPSGLGWAIAGQGLWASATPRRVAEAVAGTRTESGDP